MKKERPINIFCLILLFMAPSVVKADLSYPEFTYDGIKYTVTNMTEKTVKTQEGYFFHSHTVSEINPGNSWQEEVLELPATVEYKGEKYTLTEIGKWGFYGRKKIKKAILPSTVTKIGEEAFTECQSLEEINLTSVKVLDYGAFENCIKLRSIDVPNQLITIESNAFKGCISLSDITFPNSLTSIGGSAFEGCTSITHLTFPNSLTFIYGGAFMGCTSLSDVIFPSSLTYIGVSAFEGCSSFTILKIPEQINTIGAHAFFGCNNVKKIIFDAVECDFTGAIYPPHITDIQLSDKIRRVPSYGFAGLENITSVTLPESVQKIGQYAFKSCSSLTSYNIPSSVNTIPAYCFYQCASLREVVIPEWIRYIDQGAFQECTGLTEADVPSFVTHLAGEVFRGCTSLKRASLNNTQSKLGGYLFDGCSSLTEFEIPPSITSIDVACFRDCINLETVNLPDSLEVIGIQSFLNCKTIKEIVIPPTLSYLNDAAFRGCDSLTKLTYNAINCGHHFPYASFPSSITELKIGECVETIPGGIFFELDKVTEVYIPNSVKSFGPGAFYRCSNLKKINLPYSLEEIPYNCFSYCSSLEEILIPNSVSVIREYVFLDCINLKKLVCGYGLNSIKSMAFSGVQLSHIYITAETAPEVATDVFTDFSAVLHTLPSSQTEYHDAPVWKDFNSIQQLVTPTLFEVTPTSLSGRENDRVQLNYTLEPADVTLKEIFWFTDNPSVATVDENGVVSFMNNHGSCLIKGETLYPGVEVEVSVRTIPGLNEIEEVRVDDTPLGGDIYNMNGICVKRNATAEDIHNLPKGIYIVNGKKIAL